MTSEVTFNRIADIHAAIWMSFMVIVEVLMASVATNRLAACRAHKTLAG